MANDHRTRPTDDDEGKNVVDSTGERIGIVSAVEGGTIHVETDPGVTDSLKATLGWGDTEGTQTIDERHVGEIDDDTVHLQAEDPGATDVDADVGSEDSAADEATIAGDTGTGTGHEDASTDRNDLPPEERDDDPVSGDLSGDETAAEMDDTGDLTGGRTTGEAGASEMTDEGVSERGEDDAADEMGVPTGDDDSDPDPDDVGGMGGRDANERPPGAEDAAGREDVQDAQTDSPRGEDDVQDPVIDEPRDSEDVQDRAEDLNPADPEADPEDQPSTGEAATRGAEEDADLGRDDDDDDDDDRL